MEDGSLALGIFNLAETERTIGVTWGELRMTVTMVAFADYR